MRLRIWAKRPGTRGQSLVSPSGSAWKAIACPVSRRSPTNTFAPNTAPGRPRNALIRLATCLIFLPSSGTKSHGLQARGDRRRGFGAIEVRKSIGRLGEEGFREDQREATQFAISRRIRDRHALLFVGTGEALPATSLMLNQRVADEMNQNGKG